MSKIQEISKMLNGFGQIIDGINSLKSTAEDLGILKPSVIDIDFEAIQDPNVKSLPMKTKTVRVANTKDRIRAIRKKIHEGREDPRIIKLAKQILTVRCGNGWCIPEKDWKTEARVLSSFAKKFTNKRELFNTVDDIYKFVRKEIRYTRDTVHKDLNQAAHRTLEFQAGDCDDYCITAGSLLQAVGYNVKLRVIRTPDSKTFNHVFLLVEMPYSNKWIPFDASVNHRLGWHPNKNQVAEKKDFNV